MSGAGLRQYDIWIDGQKLSPNFLSDAETQAGHRVLLAFDGRVCMLEASPPHAEMRSTPRPRRSYAKLGGTAIEFQLLDDGDGRRVCIASGNGYLMWTHRREDGTLGTFVDFPDHPQGVQQPLVFGRTYVFADPTICWSSDSDCFINGVPKDPEMTLRVTDPLHDLEVGDGRPPSPVLDPPEPSPARASKMTGVNSLLRQLRSLGTSRE